MTQYPAPPPSLLPLGLLHARSVSGTPRYQDPGTTPLQSTLQGQPVQSSMRPGGGRSVLCALQSSDLATVRSPYAVVVHPTPLSQETIPGSLPLGHSVLPSALTYPVASVEPSAGTLFLAVPRLGEETPFSLRANVLNCIHAGLEGSVSLEGESAPASQVH